MSVAEDQVLGVIASYVEEAKHDQPLLHREAIALLVQAVSSASRLVEESRDRFLEVQASPDCTTEKLFGPASLWVQRSAGLVRLRASIRKLEGRLQ